MLFFIALTLLVFYVCVKFFVLHDIACYYILIYHQATHISKCHTLYVGKMGVASECIIAYRAWQFSAEDARM